MTENEPCKKKSRPKTSLRSLRLSLKYRPELLKLILKMRQCIKRKNALLKSLKDRLKNSESIGRKVRDANTNTISIISEKVDTLANVSNVSELSIKTKVFQDASTQTLNNVTEQDNSKSGESKLVRSKENTGWNINENGDTEKSIAEQVKEAAQNALQDTGMVYVESAGMYYDYKTGYYYNSELGLYYHTDTGCYYYYSDDKQFVFHSYPDMSKVNASLIAHQNKKARKLKRERKPEHDIDNLTEHLSQDNEEDASEPKKRRKTKTKKEKKEERKDKKRKEKSRKSSKNKKINSLNKNDEESKEKLTKEENKVTERNSTESKTDVASETKRSEDRKESENNDKNNMSLDMFENSNSSKNKCENESNNLELVNDTTKEKNADDKENIKLKGQIELEMEVPYEIKDVQSEEVKKETQELEDGECSETDNEESESDDSESDVSTSTVSDEDSIAKQHPPCMRVIVRETKLPKLKVGSLFVITKDGGTIGREGEQHAVLLKDHNVSRNHLDIRYDTAKKTYIATDLGSKNGTILNGVRMSESQEISLPLDVLHGSTIQLGETKLLCHIHPGHSTCGQCEPGLLMQVEEEKKAAYTRTVSVKKQYELELARLKNIYAPQHLAIEEKPYNDRAQARREAVGSTNHAEKTQTSDLDTSIAADNKGFKLLQKMGWSEGEGLGKDSQGDKEPVPLLSNDGKAGLGSIGAVAPPSNTPKPRVVKNNLASATMRLATRTKMLQPPAKAFQNEDEGESE